MELLLTLAWEVTVLTMADAPGAFGALQQESDSVLGLHPVFRSTSRVCSGYIPAGQLGRTTNIIRLVSTGGTQRG